MTHSSSQQGRKQFVFLSSQDRSPFFPRKVQNTPFLRKAYHNPFPFWKIEPSHRKQKTNFLFSRPNLSFRHKNGGLRFRGNCDIAIDCQTVEYYTRQSDFTGRELLNWNRGRVEKSRLTSFGRPWRRASNLGHVRAMANPCWRP